MDTQKMEQLFKSLFSPMAEFGNALGYNGGAKPPVPMEQWGRAKEFIQPVGPVPDKTRLPLANQGQMQQMQENFAKHQQYQNLQNTGRPVTPEMLAALGRAGLPNR